VVFTLMFTRRTQDRPIMWIAHAGAAPVGATTTAARAAIAQATDWLRRGFADRA
jgi:hypothetical protein